MYYPVGSTCIGRWPWSNLGAKQLQSSCQLINARVSSIERGTWYARSAEFLQTPTMQTLRWMRVPGDILFSAGAALLGWFVLGLLTGHSYQTPRPSPLAQKEELKLEAIAGD